MSAPRDSGVESFLVLFFKKELFFHDRQDGGADLHPIGNSPVVILVRPQLADNIGAVARAMANGGLFHLRLVAPRDGWPQDAAWRNASGAQRLLDALSVHETVADAVADLHHVFATCPRPRHIIKPVLTARGAAAELREICTRGCAAACCSGRSGPGWTMTTWRRPTRWCATR